MPYKWYASDISRIPTINQHGGRGRSATGIQRQEKNVGMAPGYRTKGMAEVERWRKKPSLSHSSHSPNTSKPLSNTTSYNKPTQHPAPFAPPGRVLIGVWIYLSQQDHGPPGKWLHPQLWGRPHSLRVIHPPCQVVVQKSPCDRSRCSFSPGISLSLHLSIFVSLCCLHSQTCSPLLVQIWLPAALSVPLFNSYMFSCPVFPAKIPSLVLMSFLEPITITRKRELLIGQSWVTCTPKGTDSRLRPTESTERGSFPKENGRTVKLQEGGADAEQVKAPEYPAAWAACSQNA